MHGGGGRLPAAPRNKQTKSGARSHQVLQVSPCCLAVLPPTILKPALCTDESVCLRTHCHKSPVLSGMLLRWLSFRSGCVGGVKGRSAFRSGCVGGVKCRRVWLGVGAVCCSDGCLFAPTVWVALKVGVLFAPTAGISTSIRTETFFSRYESRTCFSSGDLSRKMQVEKPYSGIWKERVSRHHRRASDGALSAVWQQDPCSQPLRASSNEHLLEEDRFAC